MENKAINQFINEWKELSFNYYMDLRAKRQEMYDEVRGLDFYERQSRMSDFYRKHGKSNVFFVEDNSSSLSNAII